MLRNSSAPGGQLGRASASALRDAERVEVAHAADLLGDVERLGGPESP